MITRTNFNIGPHETQLRPNVFHFQFCLRDGIEEQANYSFIETQIHFLIICRLEGYPIFLVLLIFGGLTFPVSNQNCHH